MNVLRNTIATLFLSSWSHAQGVPLTKDTIIQMSKVGRPDDVIVSKIRGEAWPPKMSADDLIALKSADVSDSGLWSVPLRLQSRPA